MYIKVSQNKTYKLDSTQLNKTENKHNVWEALFLSCPMHQLFDAS